MIALSEAQARAGQIEEALATIEQAFSAVGEQQCCLPGVLWWRGELHLKRGDETKAAGDFREAIAVARRIGSKAYELRATTSLARLLDKQGKRDEARAMLADIYNQFTEGFDTADLKDAKPCSTNWVHSAWLAARTGGANRSWEHNAPVACSEALFRRRLARRNPAAGASTRVASARGPAAPEEMELVTQLIIVEVEIGD